MRYELIELTTEGEFTTITLNNPARRNALSLQMMQELTHAFHTTADSAARGIILAAAGPVFCAGHDFADMARQDLIFMRKLLQRCTRLMDTIQSVPQPVLARVHALATAAGCQLVATCDLAVAADNAGFAAPGGQGGWFCHTPMVAISRNLGRKRTMELALTGQVIDAATALEWGLLNRVTSPENLHTESLKLLTAATRGSAASKGLGKQALYAQLDMSQHDAYTYAIEMMAAASQTPAAKEGMQAFMEKRRPAFEQ